MTDAAQTSAAPPAWRRWLTRLAQSRLVRAAGDKLRTSRSLQRVHAFVFPDNEEHYTDPEMDFLDPNRIIKTGLRVVVIFAVGFVGWAAIAPLDSAVVASGVVVVESHRKSIQHLEGGIIRNIYVADGQQVRAGQPLVQLDDTEARASLDLVRGEADALAAQEARLQAERDGADKITFPAELSARMQDPAVAEAIRGEQSTFDTDKATLAKQQAIFTQRISENQRVAAGLQAEQKAYTQQSGLIAQESDSVQQLYAKGLSTLPRLLQLKRQAAELAGQSGQVSEKIAQVHLDSGENELQILNLKNQFMTTVVKDLRDVQTKRFAALDRLHAAKDVVSRLLLTTPVAGKVVGLAVHSRGAVIRPGDVVMEIVPLTDQLDVEAHVRPEDIDFIHIGMTAKVGLGSYMQRRLPMIMGTVTQVSADRLTDPRTGLAYFNVEVAVDRAQLKDYPDIKLIPGMPVDVSLNTGSRTALEYFVEPISSVFRHGMRER